MNRGIALLIAAAFLVTASYAGSPGIHFIDGQAGYSGARSLSLAGAVTASPDVHSALQVNPAGLGVIKQSSVYGSFLNNQISDENEIYGDASEASDGFSGLSNLGMTLSMPTARGSLVFGVSYHRARQLDELFSAHWLGIGSGNVYEETIDLEDVEKFADLYNEGFLSRTAIGGAVEVSPGLFLGGSAIFWSGHKDYSLLFDRLRGLYTLNFTDGSSEDWVFPNLYETQTYHERYSGFNLSGGFHYQIHPQFSIAGSIETPVTIKAERDWTYEFWEDYEPYLDLIDLSPDSLPAPYYDEGPIDYKIQKPWTVRLGGLFEKGPVQLSADAVWTDYSQMKYKTDPPVDGSTELMANREIRLNYQSVMEMHAGAQVEIPGSPVVLRGGYAVIPSSLKKGSDTTLFGLGAGFQLNEQFQIDFGFAQTQWDGPGFDEIAIERVKTNRIQISASYLIP